jgi:hypothetical protein
MFLPQHLQTAQQLKEKVPGKPVVFSSQRGIFHAVIE